MIGRKTTRHGMACLMVLCGVVVAVLPGDQAAAFGEDADTTAADATGPWTLRYQFEDGETLRMQVRHRAVSDTTIAGTTQSVETSTDSTKVWRVSSAPEGGMVLEHSVDDVRMHSRTSDRGSP